jgi:hypothetical protein
MLLWCESFEKTAEIINVEFEPTIICIDSFLDELIFAKRFVLDCDKKKRWQEKWTCEYK